MSHPSSLTPLVCSVCGTLARSAAAAAYKAARRVDPDRNERDSVLDLHSAMIQASAIKTTSLCLRVRSSADLPPVDKAGSFEDAAGRMVGLRVRDE